MPFKPAWLVRHFAGHNSLEIMIQPDQIILFLADAYHEAALARANMRVAVDAIETMRVAMFSENDIFDAWNILDDQVNRVAEAQNLQPVLIALRQKWITFIRDDECERLRQIFVADSAIGWKAWLNSYAGALTQFRLDFAGELCKAALPYPEDGELSIAKIQLLTDRARHARWAEAITLFSLLGEKEILIPEFRARLLTIASDISALYLYQFDRAKAFLDKAETLCANDWHLLFSRGNYYFWQPGNDDPQQNLKNKEQAKAYYQRLIQQFPEVSLGYMGLAEFMEKENDLAGAVENSLLASRCLVSPSDGYASLLRLYAQKSLFELHRDEIPLIVDRNCAVALNAHDIYQAYLRAGYAFQLNDNLEEARRWYKKAIKFDPTRLQAYISEAYLCLDIRDYQNAGINFQKTIEVAPESIEGYWGMSQLTEEQEKWEEAIQWYEDSLKRLPEWGSFIHIRIGNIKQKQNLADDAINEYFKALKADAISSDALNALNGIADDMYKRQGDKDGALELYQKIRVLAGSGYEKNYCNLVGNLYFYYGEYREAADEYKKALVTDPDEPRFSSNLALAIEKLRTPGHIHEELDEAISYVSHAIELEPDSPEYAGQLLRLEQFHKMVLRYGEQILTFDPVEKKVQVQVENSAMLLLLDVEKTNLASGVLKNIAAMRQRILAQSGMDIPGIDFVWLEARGAFAGDYQIDIMGQQMAYGQIHNERKFAFCTPDQVKEFEPGCIAPYLLPSEEKLANGCWLDESQLTHANSMGLEVIENVSYLLSHLETILFQNLDKFCDHQQVANLPELIKNKECSEIVSDPRKLNRFTLLLKEKLRNKGSITDLSSVCKLILQEIQVDKKPPFITEMIEPETTPGISSISMYFSSSSSLDKKMLEEEIRKIQPYIFSESGIVIPEIQLVESDEINQNDLQLQFNDKRLPISPGLATDEILVFVPFQDMKNRFPDSREFIDPTTLASFSIIKATEEARKEIDLKQYDKRDPVEYVIYYIAAELRFRFEQLLDIEVVRYFVIKLKQDYPVLINIISFFFTDVALTGRLKVLLKNGTSIKNLPVVFENILADMN